jgi:hypothetical protein
MADFTTSLTITLPDGVTAVDFRDAIAREWHYQDTLPGGDPNPETKVDFIKRRIGEGLRSAYEADLVKVASETARADNETVREEFVIT